MVDARPSWTNSGARNNSAARRQDYYNSQRGSLSSRPTSATSQDYGGPQTPNDRALHPDGNGRNGEKASRPLSNGSRLSARHQRNVSYRDSASLDDPYDLSEIAAPPPVHDGRQEDRDQSADLAGTPRHLENQESGEGSGDTVGPYAPRTAADYIQQDSSPKQAPKWLTDLYTVSYLIFFAIFGTLARLGTQWITFYPGAPIITPVIWANLAGSFIMGFLSEDQALFRLEPVLGESKGHTEGRGIAVEDKASHTKRKKTIPLYVGLATGFCGSYTSFSSFARDYFLAISNDVPAPIYHPSTDPTSATIQTTVSRNGGYSFQAWLHIVLATLALSLGGLLVGAQIAVFLESYTPRIHGKFVRKVVDPAMVVLGLGCWLGSVFMCIWPPHNQWRGEALFAIVLAPIGCLLRFYASLKLNALVPAFPLGTFTVNMLGTAVLGMAWDLQHVGVGVMGRVGGGQTGCQVLQGVMDGFCGCLTTVSTWVAEINGLKRKHGWLYAFATVVGALCLLTVIMGSVRWSVGWQLPVCSTGYTGKVNG